MERGASSSLGFYDAAILNGGAFLGCFALGLVADSGLGIFNSVVAATFACAAVAFAWIGAHNNAGVIVWAVAYGIASGALQAIFSPCVSELAPTPEVIGSWNGGDCIFSSLCTSLMGLLFPAGICITISSFAVLATGPIAGKLLENTGGASYLPMQLFTAISLTLAGILLMVTRLWVSRAVFA